MTLSPDEVLDAFAPHVLARFLPTQTSAQIVSLGSYGGFSGARIWRCRAGDETRCLRAWPVDVRAWQLEYVHLLMKKAYAAGLAFVPRLLSCSDRTLSYSVDRLWELTSWQPREPSSPASLTEARVRAACKALPRLHIAWSLESSDLGPCPAIARRLTLSRDWTAVLGTGWQPRSSAHAADRLAQITERAWRH